MSSNQFATCESRSGIATGAITVYRAVKIATTGTEKHKFAQAGASDGALAAADGVVGVAFDGYGAAEVNGNSTNIAAGDPLKPGANGILVKATAGDHYIAFAQEPATVDGVIIRVKIQKGQLSVAPAG
jgi:hypothetical protein